MKYKFAIVILLFLPLLLAGCSNPIDVVGARLFLELGKLDNSMGRTDSAINQLGKAIELDPQFIEAYSTRADIYYDEEQFDLAVADYSEAIKLDPKNQRYLCDRGNSYYDLERYDLAIADFSAAIELDPQNAYAYCGRGKAYSKVRREYKTENGGTISLSSTKDRDLALSDYNQAIEIDPKFTNVYFYRGNLYFSKGKFDLSIADYSKVLELDAFRPSAYYNRGLANYRLGNKTKAIMDLENCLKLTNDPDLNNAATTLMNKLK